MVPYKEYPLMEGPSLLPDGCLPCAGVYIDKGLYSRRKRLNYFRSQYSRDILTCIDIIGSSTLSWTLKIGASRMKRIILGADLLCQNKDAHLQQISKDKWFSSIKTESQEQPLRESMSLAHLHWIAGSNKLKPQVRFLKKITELLKRMISSI